MEIKIFSANHIVKNETSLQEIKKIDRADSPLSLWFLAGFQDYNPALKAVFQKITTVFDNAFFSNPNDDVFERMEETLKIVNDEIREEMTSLDKSLFQQGGFLIALFADNTLYFTSYGTPEVYFIRKGRFTLISEGLSEQTESGDVFSNVANGELKNDDKIIFATTRILRHATGNQIAEAVQSGVTESVEALKFLLPERDPLALVVFHVKGLSTLPFQQKEESGFFKKFAESKIAQSEFSQKTRGWFGKFFSSAATHRNTAVIFAILIGLTLVAIFFGLVSEQKNDNQRETYRLQIEELKKDLSSVEVRQLEGKKDEANQLLAKIETLGRQIQAESTYFGPEIMEILDQAGKKRDEINGVTRIKGARIIADLKTAKENTELRGIFEYDHDYFAYDSKTLFQMLSANGETKGSFNLTENEQIIAGVDMKAKSRLIFLTDKGKIIEFKDGETKFAATTDDKFQKGITIDTFSKYLYLLDPAGNQIWKYERKDASFGEAQEYSVNADLSQAISLAIDGNVFVLTSDGRLLKLYRGNQEEYNTKNAPGGDLKGLSKVYTRDSLEELYFLDPAQKAILIFSKGQKEAVYQNQVVIEDVNEITDFWVDPETDSLIFTDKTKVYEVKLP